MDIQHKPPYEKLRRKCHRWKKNDKIDNITCEFKTRCEIDLSSSKEYSK